MISVENHLLSATDFLVLVLYSLPFALIAYVSLKGFEWAGRAFRMHSTLSDRNTSPSDDIRDQAADPQAGDSTETCPICMSPVVFKVQTSCGHNFCEPCFFLHWRASIFSRTIKCPLCRSPVSHLTELFTEEERPRGQMQQSFVRTFNRSFSRSTHLFQRPQDLFYILWDTVLVLMRGGLSRLWDNIRPFLIPLAVVLYFFSPLDLLPEAVMGPLGLADDLLVIGFYLFYLCRLVWRSLR